MHGHRIRGPDAALQTFLARVLVHSEVLGIEERPGEVEIWLADGSALPAVRGLDLDITATGAPRSWTGLEHDAPVWIAPDLLVRPPWVDRPSGFAGIELVVPRGMAFGSGEHESTRLALLLERELLQAGQSFADVGTGSGILALHAAHRGCRPLRACDIDVDAVRAARELVPALDVLEGGPERLLEHGQVDHVVANMTGTELLACAPALGALWNGRSALVVSGVRPPEAEAVFAALPARPDLVRAGRDFLAAALRPRARSRAESGNA